MDNGWIGRNRRFLVFLFFLGNAKVTLTHTLDAATGWVFILEFLSLSVFLISDLFRC